MLALKAPSIPYMRNIPAKEPTVADLTNHGAAHMDAAELKDFAVFAHTGHLNPNALLLYAPF